MLGDGIPTKDYVDDRADIANNIMDPCQPKLHTTLLSPMSLSMSSCEMMHAPKHTSVWRFLTPTRLGTFENDFDRLGRLLDYHSHYRR